MQEYNRKAEMLVDLVVGIIEHGVSGQDATETVKAVKGERSELDH